MAAQTNTTTLPDFRERQARTLLHHLVQFIHIAVDDETIAVAPIHSGPYCIVTAAVVATIETQAVISFGSCK